MSNGFEKLPFFSRLTSQEANGFHKFGERFFQIEGTKWGRTFTYQENGEVIATSNKGSKGAMAIRNFLRVIGTITIIPALIALVSKWDHRGFKEYHIIKKPEGSARTSHEVAQTIIPTYQKTNDLSLGSYLLKKYPEFQEQIPSLNDVTAKELQQMGDPLHFAVDNSDWELFHLLVDGGIDVNEPSKIDNSTILEKLVHKQNSGDASDACMDCIKEVLNKIKNTPEFPHIMKQVTSMPSKESAGRLLLPLLLDAAQDNEGIALLARSLDTSDDAWLVEKLHSWLKSNDITALQSLVQGVLQNRYLEQSQDVLIKAIKQSPLEVKMTFKDIVILTADIHHDYVASYQLLLETSPNTDESPLLQKAFLAFNPLDIARPSALLVLSRLIEHSKQLQTLRAEGEISPLAQLIQKLKATDDSWLAKQLSECVKKNKIADLTEVVHEVLLNKELKQTGLVALEYIASGRVPVDASVDPSMLQMSLLYKAAQKGDMALFMDLFRLGAHPLAVSFLPRAKKYHQLGPTTPLASLALHCKANDEDELFNFLKWCRDNQLPILPEQLHELIHALIDNKNLSRSKVIAFLEPFSVLDLHSPDTYGLTVYAKARAHKDATIVQWLETKGFGN